jgi:phosphatidate cytidylyltransferase
MFYQRALISFTLGPLALLLLWLGGWFLLVPIVALVTVAVHEYSGMMRHMGRNVPFRPTALLVAAMLVAAWGLAWPGLNGLMLVALFVVMGMALWQYEKGGRDGVSADWAATVLALVLFGWMGAHFLLLRNLDPAAGSIAWRWSAFAILATWGADTAAFLVGSFVAGRGIFGRHPLSPRLSPKKSVEGYLGGIVLGLPFNWIVGVLLLRLPLWHVLGLGLILAVLTTAGDLAFSLLKREAGVKDSGTLFPGHGGALDRIDSVIWAVVIAYHYLWWLGLP